ncbi:MAG: molybdopterin-dependent oxidoreductase [Clostridia bacterium]|nr:molybdopterin-dependent oxidoreductase [Clostridia bacterium]
MFRKRIVILLSLLVMTVFVLGGCTQPETGPAGNGDSEDPVGGEVAEAVEIGEWSIEIEVADKEAVNFTNVEAADLGPVEFTAAQKDGDEFKETQTFTGILLEDLLEYVGVTDFTVISVEGADGSSREMPPDRLALETTGIAWAVDGKSLDAGCGPVQFIADQRGPKWWIKQVTKIFIVE